MKRYPVSIAIGLLMFFAAFALTGQTQKTITETPGHLLIVADERPPMDALADFLEDHGGFETHYIEQDKLSTDLADWAAVLMYIHGPMTPRTERILIDYALAGGRLVILHHGIASARLNNPDWLNLTGIDIKPRNHPTHPWRVVSNTTHTLVNLRGDHYITSHNITWPRTVEYQPSDTPSTPQTLPAIDLPRTEVFLNQHFTDARAKTVLLGFRCTDPQTGKTYMQDRAGWYKTAGKGHLFYFQPGHATPDFKNKTYTQIILNALNWKP